MGWFSRRSKVPAPEEVPQEQLSDLSREYLSWKSTLVFAVGVILVLTFVHTMSTNATVSGFASAAGDSGERFTGLLSILIVIFAFFALALFLWKKSNQYK